LQGDGAAFVADVIRLRLREGDIAQQGAGALTVVAPTMTPTFAVVIMLLVCTFCTFVTLNNVLKHHA